MYTNARGQRTTRALGELSAIETHLANGGVVRTEQQDHIESSGLSERRYDYITTLENTAGVVERSWRTLGVGATLEAHDFYVSKGV